MAAARKTRLSDIAKALGVSSATVSRALSGQGYVRPDLAAQIRKTAQDMQYRMPRPQAGQRVMLLASDAAMIDFQRNQFTMYVLQGLRRRAGRLGLVLEIRTVDPAATEALTAELSAPDITGALLLTIGDGLLEFARALPCPVVLINGDDPDMALSSVTPCNRSAAALATQHLQALGHQQIAFLNRPGRRTIQRRLEGWADVMGPRARDALILDVDDWTAAAAQQAVSTALHAGLRFTGIVAAADVLAAGAMKALWQAGLRVPQDVSVIGMDGLPQGELQTPPLTSVGIPMEDVGVMALDLLSDIGQRRALNDPLPARRIELACALVPRASTAPPPMGPPPAHPKSS